MNNKDFSKYSDLALLLLRIGVGIVFIVAGWGKIIGLFGYLFSGDEWGFIATVDGIGFPLPAFFAAIVAITEFIGGLMVLFGVYARIPNLLLAFIMLVALFTTKMDGFDISHAGTRVDILMLLITLSLAIMGSGKYSVDSMIGKN